MEAKGFFDVPRHLTLWLAVCLGQIPECNLPSGLMGLLDAQPIGPDMNRCLCPSKVFGDFRGRVLRIGTAYKLILGLGPTATDGHASHLPANFQ